MIMKMHKLLWKILFANQKSGISGAFRDLESLVLFFLFFIYYCFYEHFYTAQ